MHQYKVKKINRVIDRRTQVDLDNLRLEVYSVTISQRIRLKDIDATETRTKNLEEKESGRS
jgi:endonuclease YncB( thermonuclease family)